MRSNKWLNSRLENIWRLLFPDAPRANTVVIEFKGKWKNKFGHIEGGRKKSKIIVNSLFKHEEVPECIIDTTIAHELTHYMHGFNSPLPNKFKYPHKHGIVDKELLKRGFAHSMRLEKYFFKKDWSKLHKRLLEKEKLDKIFK